MSARPPVDRPSAGPGFEGRAGPEDAPERYELALYVVGVTQRSLDAVRTIRTLCEQHLADRYTLEVFDIAARPELAREAQIVATPTLIKRLPMPLRRLIGDLSSRDRVLVGLGLQVRRSTDA